MRKITARVLCLAVFTSFLSTACHALTQEEIDKIRDALKPNFEAVNERINRTQDELDKIKDGLNEKINKLDEKVRRLEDGDGGYQRHRDPIYGDGEYPPSHPTYPDGASRHIYVHKTVRHIYEHRYVHCCRPIWDYDPCWEPW